MPTLITNTTIESAKRAAVPGCRRYQVVDARSPGLVLRVGARGAAWNMRFQLNGKERRLALGGVDAWTLPEVRSLVDQAQSMLRDRTGVPNEAWLDRMRQRAGKDVAVNLTPPVAPPREQFKWTFDSGRTRFLEEKKRTRAAGTYDDYRQKLGLAELSEFEKTPLPRISRRDLARVIGDIHRSGREATAEGVARVLSSMWSWLATDVVIGHSGVQAGVMRGLRAPERTRKTSRRLVADPTLEDLGRVVAICRSGVIDPVVAYAVEMVVWTLQRRRAVASAQVDDFKPIGDGAEGLWFVYADDRKRSDGEEHVIPLPPPAWQCYLRAADIAKAKGSEWLFPQTRPRRRGGTVTHLHGSTLTHAMHKMPGVTSTPHHVRSIFATFGEAILGFSRPTTRLILDHSEGGVRSDVTGRHYALHTGEHEKWPVMRRWVSAIEADVEKAMSTMEPVEDLQAAIAAARDRKNSTAG